MYVRERVDAERADARVRVGDLFFLGDSSERFWASDRTVARAAVILLPRDGRRRENPPDRPKSAPSAKSRGVPRRCTRVSGTRVHATHASRRGIVQFQYGMSIERAFVTRCGIVWTFLRDPRRRRRSRRRVFRVSLRRLSFPRGSSEPRSRVRPAIERKRQLEQSRKRNLRSSLYPTPALSKERTPVAFSLFKERLLFTM